MLCWLLDLIMLCRLKYGNLGHLSSASSMFWQCVYQRAHCVRLLGQLYYIHFTGHTLSEAYFQVGHFVFMQACTTVYNFCWHRNKCARMCLGDFEVEV